MSPWNAINARLKRVEQNQAVQSVTVEVQRAYEFTVAPSCPPDKRLHIRGGYATASDGFDGTLLVSTTPSVICDFENQDETDMALQFSNTSWYLPIILCYYGDWIASRTLGVAYETPIFDNVTGVEVETPAEAEAQIDAWMNGYTEWSYYRFPLHGVVLRNDGSINTNYAILPIDLVNRSRSYLYRDARTWTSLGSS